MRAALALSVALAPALALACPSCARDQDSLAFLYVGGLMVAPYVVAALVVRAVRSMGGER